MGSNDDLRRKDELTETILHALTCSEGLLPSVGYPQTWLQFGKQLGFRQGFAAEAHNSTSRINISALARIMWMLYSGERTLDTLPQAEHIHPVHQAPNEWVRAGSKLARHWPG